LDDSWADATAIGLVPESVTVLVIVSVVWQTWPAGDAHVSVILTPFPVEVGRFVSRKLGFAAALNVTVTFWSELIGTVQVVVSPEHPPPTQPANVEPAAGLSVSVTFLPVANCAEHVAPQLMPSGTLVTVPDPEPVRDTDSLWVGASCVNVAVAVVEGTLELSLAVIVGCAIRIDAVIGAV
jgi:hypothetical protein